MSIFIIFSLKGLCLYFLKVAAKFTIDADAVLRRRLYQAEKTGLKLGRVNRGVDRGVVNQHLIGAVRIFLSRFEIVVDEPLGVDGELFLPYSLNVPLLALNAALALTLMQFYGFVGIAAATGITVWVNAIQYMYRLKRQGEFSLDATFKYRLPRIVAAGVTMGVCLLLTLRFFAGYYPNWQHETNFHSVLLLGLLVFIGAAVFALVLIGSGGIPLNEIKRFIRRGK